MGQDAIPQPEEDWVEIRAVSNSDQRADAKAFLEDARVPEDNILTESLAQLNWYQTFPAALGRVDPGLAAKWNRRRSFGIASKVEEWRKANTLDENLVYDWSPVTPLAGSEQGISLRTDLRAAMLAAVQRLSTEELISLPIAAKHLIPVLRPDLLRH